MCAFQLASNLDIKLDLDYLKQLVSENNQQFTGLHEGIELHSNYQSIYSPIHGRVVGYEALLRARRKQQVISPLQVFENCSTHHETVLIDRLSRYLHLSNFTRQMDNVDQAQWIFLNVNPEVALKGTQYGAFFADVIKELNIPANRIVIEIIEGSTKDEHLLSDAVNYYRELGCLIAIDDFGAGYSNFNRIWSSSPDLVKMDRSIISQARESKIIRNMLANLISMIHESGGLALIEGIESEEEALIAIDSNADLLQGYYIKKPSLLEEQQQASVEHLQGLVHRQFQAAKQRSSDCRKKLSELQSCFVNVISKIQDGENTLSASHELLQLPRVKRCYMIDENGFQEGKSLTNVNHLNQKFAPMNEDNSADWSLRPYYRRAIENIGELQISRPYLSISDGEIVVTLSYAFDNNGQKQVFCSDFEWHDHHCKSFYL